MDELVVRPEALIRRAKSWEEAAAWLHDSERELAGVSPAAAGKALRPAAARFWAAAEMRTRVGRQAADEVARGLREVVVDVEDADQQVADGLLAGAQRGAVRR